MKRRSLVPETLVVYGLLLLLDVSLGAAPKGPAPSNSIPLNLSLRDSASDGVQSDINGAYSDGVDNVRVELLDNTEGNLVIDMNENKGDGGRRLTILFPWGAIPPSSFYPVSGGKDTFTGTLSNTGADDLRSLRVGDPAVSRRFPITWAEGSYSYALRWNGPANGHGFVWFSCVSESAGACTQWKASPVGSVGLYYKPTRGNYTEALLTTLEMPFELTLGRK